MKYLNFSIFQHINFMKKRKVYKYEWFPFIMLKTKALRISDKLWKKISQDKLDLGLSTQEDVIWFLYKSLGELNKLEKKYSKGGEKKLHSKK